MQESILSILTSETENIFVAYSGGIDSHVLLHVTSTIALVKPKITAVYINHGLQKEAVQWAEHCEKKAIALGVSFKCIKVNAQQTKGKSPEEAARDARYSALKSLLKNNDVMLLAQHREDQMETVLLQLFRGAGVRGLSGMPLSTSFGKGQMVRPFLDVPKQDINSYAKDNNLKWIEDSSNQCDDFDRNFLRNQIVPQLKQRWSALDKTVARSARHCATSARITEGVAKELLDKVIDENKKTLEIAPLLKLDVESQCLVIRQWFDTLSLRMPSEKKLEIIINEMILAKVDANPKIQEQDHFITRYKGKLYYLNQGLDHQQMTDMLWPKGQKKQNFKMKGSLELIDSSEGISQALWNNSEVSIKFRKGSEKIRLPGRRGAHSLKNLFQETEIPPWERNNLPLVYINGQLAAIANLWISADFYSVEKDNCYQLK